MHRTAFPRHVTGRALQAGTAKRFGAGEFIPPKPPAFPADSFHGQATRAPITKDATKEAIVPGIQIGELLVEQGVLSEAQVRHILAVQRMSHRPFGDLAERLYGISPKAVEDAWVDQYLRTAGVVDLEEQEIDRAACGFSAAGRRGSSTCFRWKKGTIH